MNIVRGVLLNDAVGMQSVLLSSQIWQCRRWPCGGCRLTCEVATAIAARALESLGKSVLLKMLLLPLLLLLLRLVHVEGLATLLRQRPDVAARAGGEPTVHRRIRHQRGARRRLQATVNKGSGAVAHRRQLLGEEEVFGPELRHDLSRLLLESPQKLLR